MCDEIKCPNCATVIPQPKKMGRPSKYKTTFPDLLIKHMEQGFSFESFSATVGVGTRILYNWETTFPDFALAKDIGNSARLKFCEANILRMAAGGTGNVTAQIFILKNLGSGLKWGDKVETENTNINIDSIGPRFGVK
jgi:hypothetical protein